MKFRLKNTCDEIREVLPDKAKNLEINFKTNSLEVKHDGKELNTTDKEILRKKMDELGYVED